MKQKLAELEKLSEQVRPLTLAHNHRQKVPAFLESVFPEGIRSGSCVAITGVARRVIAAQFLAICNGWNAIVGMKDYGYLAASELGVNLDRLLVVDVKDQTEWLRSIAVLISGVNTIMAEPDRPVCSHHGRRLRAKLSTKGGVLLLVGDKKLWPEPVDVTLEGVSQVWEGLGMGHGRLCSREVTLAVTNKNNPMGSLVSFKV